jgi:hypothetical protein
MVVVDNGARLRQWVAELGVEHGIEHSIKILPGAVWTHRFLLSIYKDDLGREPMQRLLPLCMALRMPSCCHDILASGIASARFVHLGFEEADGQGTYKLYLEFPPGYEEPVMPGVGLSRGHGWLVHKAMKWRAEQPEQCTIARYWGGPGLARAAVVGRIEAAYGDRQRTVAAALPLQVLGLVQERMGIEEMFLLEVEEEGNPRHSFDMNLYDAELTLGDIFPLLMSSREYFGIAEIEANRLLAPLAHEVLGHLSGGIDRGGREFCTIYFGVRPVRLLA